MKVYVKSNEYKEQPMSVVNIVIDFVIDNPDFFDDKVAATVCILSERNIRLVGRDGQIIEDAYEGFIDTVILTASKMGLFCLHEDESEFELDGKKSKSRYLDFCVEDKLDSNAVRFVFFIRISDHSDRNRNHVRHANLRLAKYEDSEIAVNNDIEGQINPEIRRITINKRTYPTVNRAMAEIRRIFQELKDNEANA